MEDYGVISIFDIKGVKWIKIHTPLHDYEMRLSNLDPLLQKFSIRIDNEFKASRYDSLDRVLKLIEVSNSGYISIHEKELSDHINYLESKIKRLEKECYYLESNLSDAQVVIDGQKNVSSH